MLSSDVRSQRQASYQILVSKQKEFSSENSQVWDSGKVDSGQCLNIPYKGEKLAAGRKYYWKVRVWDGKNNPGAFSDTAEFCMGLPNFSDWAGSMWIGQVEEEAYLNKLKQRRDAEDKQFGASVDRFYLGSGIWDLYSFEPRLDPAPLFRKTFQLPGKKKIESAMLYICGLGYYELHFNGLTLNNGINPARSDYDKSLYYMTYDVSDCLQDGTNAIGVLLGHGWYNMITRGTFSESEASWTGQPKLLLKLEIKYRDGKTVTVVSDKSWKTDASAVLWTDVRAGEVYDARLEKTWDKSDFDDSQWKNAHSVPAPKGELISQIMPPVRITKTIKPASMKETSPGIYVYDMGQNFAGWVRLKVKGDAGTKVTVSMAEQPTGGDEFIPGEMERRQQYVYILKGTGQTEIYEPHFNYYGFQYVQLKGFPGVPTLDSIEGCFVHTDLDQVGQFSCSNPLLNKLQQNIWWTALSLVHSYPQDCPHREKNGWGDFNTLAGRAVAWNFDSVLFFEKWMRDCKDQFQKCGAVGNIIPVAGEQGPGDPAWAAAWAVSAWNNYLYYGDKKVLSDNYEEWKNWIKAVKQRQTHGGSELIIGGIGDWVAPVSYGPYYPAGAEGPSVVTTSYYYTMVNIVARAAQILGHSKDAEEYSRWAESIREKFNAAFYNQTRKYYETEQKVGFRQASQVVPISMGLVPHERYEALTELLVDDIFARHDGHLDTGTIGTSHLLHVLPLLDLHDAAYSVVSQTTYPGWLYHIVKYDATTVWENWNEGGSHNHSCFLCVGSYFYEGLAGIRIDPEQPGFKHIIIRPGLPAKLDSAKASYTCPYGEISSAWERKNGQVYLNVSVPVNTTADISVPRDGMGEVQITESGKMVWNGHQFKPVAGLSAAAEEKEYVTFKAGSGGYQFVVTSKSEPLALGRNSQVAVSCKPGTIDMQPGETVSFVIRVENNEFSAVSKPSLTLEVPENCQLECSSKKGFREIPASGSADYQYHITIPESIGVCKVLFLSGHLKGFLKGKSVDVPFAVQVNVLKRILVESRQFHEIADYSKPVEMVEIENLSDTAKAFDLHCKLPSGWKALQKVPFRAEVSSQLDDNNRPARLCDNIINHSEMNRWHSAIEARFPHTIDIYLEKPADIKQMLIHASSFVVYCKDIRLEYKDAKGMWHTIVEKELQREWANTLDMNVVTDQMKLTILSSVDNMNPNDPHFAQLNEIELLGDETSNEVSIARVIESSRKEIISLYLNPGNDLGSLRKAELKLDLDGKQFWKNQIDLQGMAGH